MYNMRCLYLMALCCFSSLTQAQEMATAAIGHPPLKAGASSSQNATWPQAADNTQVSFVSSDIRFVKDQAPNVAIESRWDAVAWKGEKIHTQILIQTRQNAGNIQVQVSDLVNAAGQRVNSKNVKAGFVQYVWTDAFGKGCGARKTTDFDSSLVADVVDTTAFMAVASNTAQPVWVSITIPQNAASGKYTGTVTVQADQTFQLPISVKVLDHVLPSPSEWQFDLDLWQHPAAIARVHNVPLWSAEHYRLMKPYYTMLASAGQKNITTSIIHEPWNHQTYDDFPSLIKWTKRKDGGWVYDYTLFDQYVSFVMSCGINQRINCYSMVPWKMSFQYFDEASGKDTFVVAKTGSPEYNAHWGRMLKDFTRHLKQKGWFGKTAIAMDERPMKDMQAVITLLKSIDKNWKITLAGDYHAEIEKDIYEYCVASKWQLESEVLQRRKAQQKPTTYYTCCVEAYPNGFTFSPPAEHVWIGWYAAAKGFTGYLRWAYNSWVADPLQDSRFRTWPAGDTYQVYPGPRTSIRFEKLIEGIQDFEKIRILRQKFTQANNKTKLDALNQLLAVYEIQALANTPAAEMVKTTKAALNEL